MTGPSFIVGVLLSCPCLLLFAQLGGSSSQLSKCLLQSSLLPFTDCVDGHPDPLWPFEKMSAAFIFLKLIRAFRMLIR